MQSWDAAFAKVRKRKIDVWNDLAVETPFEYDPSDTDSFFSSFLIENPPGHAELVLERVDRDRLWASEILITSQKFIHVLRLTSRRAQTGNVTWAATDAHHAVLLGIKCFLATIGVGICQGHNRVHLVDFRPELGTPQDEKKFRRQNKGVTNPLRVLTPTPKNLEQRHLFDAFNRLLKILVTDTARENLFEAANSLKLGTHQSERNRLLYHSDYWHWWGDLTWPTIDLGMEKEIGKNAEGLAKDFFVLKIIAEIVMGSIRPLGRTLAVEDTYFEPITMDDLCVEDALAFFPA
jgi:hypothetical protein